MKTVLILGSTDFGSACALRLFRSGLNPVLLDEKRPLDLHNNRTFSAAAYSGQKTIDGIRARIISNAIENDSVEPDASVLDFVRFSTANREIPFIYPEDLAQLSALEIPYVVDAGTLLFRDLKDQISDDARLIGTSTSPDSEHYHYRISDVPANYGRVLYPFLENRLAAETAAEPDEKLYTVPAPLEGVFTSHKEISNLIHEKEEIGKINNIPILSPAAGRISGLLNSGLIVQAKTDLAEIGPVPDEQRCNFISGEIFCLAGAVLEAIMYDRMLTEK